METLDQLCTARGRAENKRVPEVNCWEFMNCGKERTGDCPAYPNGGKVCYLFAGTLCGGMIQGIHAIKIQTCRQCVFYKHLRSRK